MSKPTELECEKVEVIVRFPDGARSYRISSTGGRMVELLTQLYSLGNIEAVKLEPVYVGYAGKERVRQGVDRRPDEPNCREARGRNSISDVD